ncbi:MAG: CO/xanthine dehydrogenase Mo-binding subunit [Candidatus Azotimanducaceae bacterium]|jgi:CO/xanthine dehydrogenase Mo-binding subunit
MKKSNYRVIGQRPLRVDSIEKVLGKARFGADYSLPGMIHGMTLRSDQTHANILEIDTQAAQDLPGVFAVVTAEDFSPLNPGGIGDIARDNLAIEKVLYRGHAVAAVAAQTRAIAERACALISVKYEVLPMVMTLDDALKPGASVLHRHLGADNGAGRYNGYSANVYEQAFEERGDVDIAFAAAEVIVEREFTTPTVHQGYIEPPTCLADYCDGGQSTLWSTTQGHFPLRDSVAKMVGCGQSDIKVIPTEVGGAFGGKTAVYQEAIAYMLSKKSGRPVKMCMTRAETLQCAGPGAGTKTHVRIGAMRDGTITAMQAKLIYESGAFPAAPTAGGIRSIFSGYDVPNIKIEGLSVVLNKAKVRAYRGPGAPQAAFAAESVLNDLSEKLGIDPIELRLKNAVKKGSTTLVGTFRDIGFEECLNAARDSQHYKSPLGPSQGRAIAAGFWRNGAGTSSASVHMNADGTASIASGSADLSGTRTSLAMIAAEQLQIPLEHISSTVADTESIGFTGMSGGSRTINATGQAVAEACIDAIEQMKMQAASGWNVTPDQIEWRDGSAHNKMTHEFLSAKQICKAANASTGPIVGGSTLNAVPGVGPSFAVHICDVEVDADTGAVTLLRYTAIQDVGTAIHLDAVEGQMQGGAVQGIGWALNEEYIFDAEGQLENPGFLDYRIPLASDLPWIETIMVEVPNDMHPFGVRGVGESPIIPPLAAVACAVGHAIGVKISDLPCSPPRVLAALKKKAG